ncbi:feruloyl-CoA synthase, partial [Pseudomonas fluorescens]
MGFEFRAQPHTEASAPRYRHLAIGRAAVEVTEQQCALHMRSLEPLAEYPSRLLDRLVHWALVRPEQTCIAARQADG